MMARIFSVFLIVIFFLSACQEKEKPGILVFSKTEAFRHESIPAGIAMFESLGEEMDIPVTTTEDSEFLTEKNLQNFAIVVFLSTTGDILNDAQQYEFKRYIQAGGGFMGVHAAADTEYDWPWYNDLVGAYFESHPNNPNVRDASIDVVDGSHISCSHLPDRWDRTDEWYNYKSIKEGIKVVLNLDETSYEGGTNGENHPIAWYREFDGGKMFYTGGGHTEESFSEEAFVQHIKGGITYLYGEGERVDYTKTTVQPAENRFQKLVYVNNLNEPMELDLLPDGRIVFIERDGAVKLTDPKTSETAIIDSVTVFSGLEDGLLGMALDPDYNDNGWIYFYYSPPSEDENRLARFSFDPDAEKPLTDEKILLVVETQREECCHAGGAVEFDSEGNIYVSTGDNTNPHESDGHAPIDLREGRGPFDALKSAGNTNDLRGKILRITPTDDGSYVIPDGNLFPKDGSQGRPEIYVMGCRNPYRFSLDKQDGRLFWGEVGPDADNDSDKYGPRGYDEVNMAVKAGNFGWPLVIADNKPYKIRDFAKDEAGAFYDPQKPVNKSPRNTGMEELPPAQPALFYYPYAKSDIFPDFGTGSRNAMAGPVYYATDFADSEVRYPDYYDGKLFIYDWMRGWIKAVTFDENGKLASYEDFLPSLKWDNMIDVVLSPEGDFYMLEYGKGWFSQNEDARLSRLKYYKGNRSPVARIKANRTKGGVPMTVVFDASSSSDPDEDDLSFAWDFGDGNTGKGARASHAYDQPGIYDVKVTVSDKDGEESENTITIYAGNEPPMVAWKLEGGNESFFIPGQDINYAIEVSDKEDGSLGSGIADTEVTITMDFMERGYDMVVPAMGHQALSELGAREEGMALMAKSDCASCHKTNGKSIGPSYMDVSNKYRGQDGAREYLANKIISGGSGVWGETAMAAHPDLPKADVEKMVRYILRLARRNEGQVSLPSRGSYTFDKDPEKFPEGSYVLTASYVDKGAPRAEKIMARDIKILRAPVIQAIDADQMDNASTFKVTTQMVPTLEEDMEIVMVQDSALIVYEDIDLTGFTGLSIAYSSPSSFMGGGNVDFYLDDDSGTPIVSQELTETQGFVGGEVAFDFGNVNGKHDLIFKFKAKTDRGVATLRQLRLLNR